MPLPNLIIIGAQKCGTSSLHYYLDLHPEVAMSKLKELDFFTEEENWGRGVEWYARRFREAPVRGEASPLYSFFPLRRGVPERIKGVIPHVRLVYVVGDPIERLVSVWRHARDGRTGTRTFAEELAQLEDNGFVAPGRYATQLERYLPHFPQEQILVVDQHDLRHDRAGTMRRVYGFAGVAPGFTSARFAVEVNARDQRSVTPAGRRVMLALHRLIGPAATRRLGSRLPLRAVGLAQKPEERPEISAELHERLVAYFAPEVERLRALTGQAFSNWSL